MKVYQFDAELAQIYGVDEAIMIWNLQYWIEHNRANGMHFHDGHYWTWNSVEAFTQIFTFWTRAQIRRILKSLEDKGVILTGNYNQDAFVRKTWYAFTCAFEQKHLSKSTNGDAETEKCNIDNSISRVISENIIKEADKKEVPADGGLFPEEVHPTTIEKKARGTSEKLCLFADSKYSTFENFITQFNGPEYADIDLRYYFEVVSDWSASKGAKKHDWIATARNIMRRDADAGKLHRLISVPDIGLALSPDAIKYLNEMAD